MTDIATSVKSRAREAREAREPEVNILETVQDPRHRIDVMAYRVAERLCQRDPVLDALFTNIKNPLAEFLNRQLGPEPATVKPARKRAKRRVMRSRGNKSLRATS